MNFNKHFNKMWIFQKFTYNVQLYLNNCENVYKSRSLQREIIQTWSSEMKKTEKKGNRKQCA